MSFSNLDSIWRWLALLACLHVLMDWVTDNLYWIRHGREPNKHWGCMPLPIASVALCAMLALLAGAL